MKFDRFPIKVRNIGTLPHLKEILAYDVKIAIFAQLRKHKLYDHLMEVHIEAHRLLAAPDTPDKYITLQMTGQCQGIAGTVDLGSANVHGWRRLEDKP